VQRVELLEPKGKLSITEALSLSLALLHNPTLQSYAADVKTLRAGLFTNPELSIETEIILLKALQKQGEAKVTIRAALVESDQQLQMSMIAIKLIREDVLPSAKEVLNAAKNAYRIGEIGAFDLLDAQRTSFQSGQQHIEALADFQINTARIERLIGGALSPASNRITEQQK